MANGGEALPWEGTTATDTPETQISGVDDYFDSNCSTPYVSAPSSPGRPATAVALCFFSAPASPSRFFSSSLSPSSSPLPPIDPSGDFEFSARPPCAGSGSSALMPPATMISADELFFNGQIRPMRSSWKPQKTDPVGSDGSDVAAPSGPVFSTDDQDRVLGRDLRSKNQSIRRRARSLSPLRNAEPEWTEFISSTRDEQEEEESQHKAGDPSPAVGMARRSSRRWMSIKEFLYRSKSEGRGYVKEKLSWSSLSFSPSKEKKATVPAVASEKKKRSARDGPRMRRTPTPSVHDLHYTAKRAQSEEMRRRTYLPYRQGLLGCLGFSSRSYSMVNGLAKTLHHHPVPSK